MAPEQGQQALAIRQKPLTHSQGPSFTCFYQLPAELRLQVWEFALEEAQRPRILLSHCLKPVPLETHDIIKALAATCRESNAVVAKYHKECQFQGREALCHREYEATHIHPDTDICLARVSWLSMCGPRRSCPTVYQRFRRFMMSAKRWLEVTHSYRSGTLAIFAKHFRDFVGDNVRQVTMLLPELSKSDLWDLDGQPWRERLLPAETGAWVSANSVPRDMFWFWTPAQMAQFEASYAARVERFPDRRAQQLYTGRSGYYVSFSETIRSGTPAIGETEGAGDGSNEGANPFDSLPDGHFLFEMRHSWRFVFGDNRLPLRIAHIRGQDAWNFLERKE